MHSSVRFRSTIPASSCSLTGVLLHSDADGQDVLARTSTRRMLRVPGASASGVVVREPHAMLHARAGHIGFDLVRTSATDPYPVFRNELARVLQAWLQLLHQGRIERQLTMKVGRLAQIEADQAPRAKRRQRISGPL